MPLKTRKQVRDEFASRGWTYSDWARQRGYSAALVCMIVNDDDGRIRDSFIAWFGCAHSKQMSMNGDLILLG